jgi:hypothetical protein
MGIVKWCHPGDLLGWFVFVPVIRKISFLLSNIKQSWSFCTFCTQNIAASNIQPIRRHAFGILLSWFGGTRPTLHQESGLKNLEPTSSIFWLFVRPWGLQIGFPNFMVLVFSPLGPTQGHTYPSPQLMWKKYYGQPHPKARTTQDHLNVKLNIFCLFPIKLGHPHPTCQKNKNKVGSTESSEKLFLWYVTTSDRFPSWNWGHLIVCNFSFCSEVRSYT